MTPGGYPQLPPRNPRSGRAKAAPARKAAPRKAHAKGRSASAAFYLSGQHKKLLMILAAVCILCFAVYLIYANLYNRQIKQLQEQEHQQQLLPPQNTQADPFLIERTKYPIKYQNHINRYAADHQVNPALIAAIIKCESDYNPTSRNEIGARGLMQFMPDSFEWIAPKFGIPADQMDAIEDPEVAIKLGCYLIRYIAEKYDGDPILTICAYHAGWGNVNSWLNKYSADGKTLTLDQIPMEDTREYTRKVMEAYAYYQHQY